MKSGWVEWMRRGGCEKWMVEWMRRGGCEKWMRRGGCEKWMGGVDEEWM